VREANGTSRDLEAARSEKILMKALSEGKRRPGAPVPDSKRRETNRRDVKQPFPVKTHKLGYSTSDVLRLDPRRGNTERMCGEIRRE